MKANGLGYNCGELACLWQALAFQPFKPVLVLFKCRKFQLSRKAAMNYSRC